MTVMSTFNQLPKNGKLDELVQEPANAKEQKAPLKDKGSKGDPKASIGPMPPEKQQIIERTGRLVSVLQDFGAGLIKELDQISSHLTR